MIIRMAFSPDLFPVSLKAKAQEKKRYFHPPVMLHLLDCLIREQRKYEGWRLLSE